MKPIHYIPLVASLICAAVPVHAAPLVYEGFDYAITDNTSMNGVATDATGLTGNYANNIGAGSVPFRYDTTGLTFSSNFYATEGGSVSLTLGSSQFGILGARFNTGTVTGTVYESYLVNFTTRTSTGENTGSYTRISNAQTATDTVRLSLAPEATIAGSAVGAGYEGSSPTTMTAGSGSLSTSTTYLFVGRFTNVGATLSGGTPGTVNLWAFTSAAYDNWRAAGANEIDLSSYASFSATDTATAGTHTFNDSAFLQFAATTIPASGLGGAIVVNYDEIRFGTLFSDVVAVPEPTVAGLVAVGCVVLFVRRDNRRGEAFRK